VALNLTELLYLPTYNVLSRPITVFPTYSQPNVGSYSARGIFDTRATDVIAEDGTIFSDAKTILDIRMAEFSVLPMQKDTIDVPDHLGSPGGTFEVADLEGVGNAGGEITLILKRIVPPKP
jgi:hypothetical protein